MMKPKETLMEGFIAFFGFIFSVIFFFLIVGIFSRLGDIRELLKARGKDESKRN